jgi:restriction endonuclease S subunit
MNGLRKLNDGKWNKPPVLTAARAVLAQGLAGHFPLCPLGRMATFVNGTSYDASLAGTGETPIIRIGNITSARAEYLRTSQAFDAKFQVAPGDLLVSWSASFKSILWPGPAGVLNQHIFKVREQDDNSRSYLRHAIEAAFDEMQRSVVGIGMMHLRRADFLGHLVPCPPPPVQRAVADYLDWVEAGRSGPEPKLPTELAEQRETVARIAAVAAKLDEVARLRTEATLQISVLLKSFLSDLSSQVGEMGQLEDVMTGKPRNGWSARCDNDPAGIPVLTLSAVTGFRYQPAAFKRTSLPVDDRAHYWLAPGDLLVTRSNTPDLVGHAAIYNGTPAPCIYPDLVMKVPLDAEVVDTRFVWFWLQSPLVRNFIVREAKGTSPTMKKISQGTVMRIPFPAALPVERQRATKLDHLQAHIDGIASQQAAVAPDIDSVLPALLHGALNSHDEDGTPGGALTAP